MKISVLEMLFLRCRCGSHVKVLRKQWVLVADTVTDQTTQIPSRNDKALFPSLPGGLTYQLCPAFAQLNRRFPPKAITAPWGGLHQGLVPRGHKEKAPRPDGARL